ncbi:MAG: RdgB/HAM1 family non-canonical purine NTP pyrophosphatase [Crenarchaeota archaeon]|nr:RdgB/HAM1 family non-canonical purine NTP pyrophosphatase [Thermoproteota archaeon]
MTRYRILLITGNVHKKREVEIILSDYESMFEVEMEPNIRKVEVQADDIYDIARQAMLDISRIVKPRKDTYLVLEDDGLYIEALGGFPGPYSEYVYRTLGLEGILKIMSGIENRSAVFRAALGVLTPSGKVEVVQGSCRGRIADSKRGKGGFGYDPIFVPLGYDITFAEMGIEEKCKISHRARAFRTLADLIVSGVLK